MMKQIEYNEKNNMEYPIYKNLDYNMDLLEGIFNQWGDIVKKKFTLLRKEKNINIYIVYIDGLTDNEMVERTITHPLMYEWNNLNWEELGQEKLLQEDVFDRILHVQTEAVDIIENTSMQGAVSAILKGDTAIFVDGYEKCLILSTKKLPTRGVAVPEKEAGLRGPKDSFNENFRINTALLRRRIKDPKLKLEQGEIGQRSRTVYGLMYMEDLAYPSLLENIKKKLSSFEIDGILDASMLVHLLEDKWYSPFPQIQTTERPDKAASALLEGRVVLVVDNSPEVLILPATLNSFFQASDDYYNRFIVGSFARILRLIAAGLAILLPGLYIAITCYYPQVLPANFLLAIVAARSNITFPIVGEVLLMELLFELLREAGIRLPGKMGNTIGVVGGLIVGQAAVEASLVSTIVVIVVALTAIASFAIPNEEFASTFRLLKFFVILMASIWGLYGIFIGVLALVIHLASLESFGIPYMMPLSAGSIDYEIEFQDYLIRKPIFSMIYRPLYTKRDNRKRFKKKGGNNV